MRVLERSRQGHEGGQGLGQGHGAPLQPALERLPHRQLHHEVEEAPARVLVEAHHAHDGGMAQGRQRLRLAHEPRARVGLAGGLHHLEGGFHAPAQGGVDAIHGAHPSFSEGGVDDPITDAVARLEHSRPS